LSGIHDVPHSMAGVERLREKLDPKHGHIPPEQVAFLILEPVQGEGGYRVPDAEFMRAVNDLCAEHDIPLIADEIQSGVGRTGEMWASDHFDFEPDVITSAKALRVGATISSADIFPDEKSRISSTWGAGDILSSIQGTLTVAAIQEHDLLSHATQVGERFLGQLEELQDDHPETIVDVRGLGLMTAVEFDTKDRREAVVDAALQRGLLTLGCGQKTLRLLPPLDVRERELDIAVDLLDDAIDHVES
ncbi:aminotransferase class III-fold pyridoxal phosphate-dependent enzyme, partial [Natrinema altunense]|uniref:aminotransferase class III-fold pyridoxal phosphate-dependent enzyme n=1 Tax=Natrinema altunense TaxID=222984 RepID=UPI001F5D9336